MVSIIWQNYIATLSILLIYKEILNTIGIHFVPSTPNHFRPALNSIRTFLVSEPLLASSHKAQHAYSITDRFEKEQ